MYNEQLEKSLEASREIEQLREKRANKSKYAEVVNTMNQNVQQQFTNLQSQRIEKNNMEKDRRQTEDQARQRYKLGNEYMKFSIDEGRKISQSPPRRKLNPIPQSALDQVILTGNLPQNEKKSRKHILNDLETKERKEKYNNLQEIFKRDKPLQKDDQDHNHSKINNLRKMDGFQSVATQALAVKTIQSMDQNLKDREKVLKEGGKDEDIDKDYMRSIQTKLEVLNGRYSSKEKKLGVKLGKNEDSARKIRVQSAITSRVQTGIIQKKEKADQTIQQSPLKSAKLVIISKPAISTAVPVNNPNNEVTTLQKSKEKKQSIEEINDDVNHIKNIEPNRKEKEIKPKVKVPETEPSQPVDALISNLSKDLDEDRSLSISLSNQQKKQQELNDYFHKKNKDLENLPDKSQQTPEEDRKREEMDDLFDNLIPSKDGNNPNKKIEGSNQNRKKKEEEGEF